MQQSRRGFTLVELLIAVVIIAVLAALSVVAYNGVQQQAQNSKIKHDTAIIKKAIMAARDSAQETLIKMDGNRMYGNGGCPTASA